MLSASEGLNERQVNSFVSFLLDGTDKAILAMENVFGLDIASSDSDIELASASESEFLQHLGEQSLYTVSSQLTGEIEGHITLLMRESDFRLLGNAMKPLLNLLFLSSPDSDLESLEENKPNWLRDEESTPAGEDFRMQMMDLLGELGNVLIGMYVKALFQIFRLNIKHSLPTTAFDLDQSTLRLLGEQANPHIVIENEFQISENNLKIWCLISPSQDTFQHLLSTTTH